MSARHPFAALFRNHIFGGRVAHNLLCAWVVLLGSTLVACESVFESASGLKCGGCVIGPTHYELTIEETEAVPAAEVKMGSLETTGYLTSRSFHLLNPGSGCLLRNHIEGWVELELTLSTDCRVKSMCVLRTSNPGFGRLVELNFRYWDYVLVERPSRMVHQLDQEYTDYVRIRFQPV
jgi:hypothetical protein